MGRWWEQLLHNQTALRLKGRLLFTPGVMVTSVPYQLRSSQLAASARPARTCGPGRRRTPGQLGTAASTRDRDDNRDSTRTPMPRTPRPSRHAASPASGSRFEVTVGPVAHGGHCVARIAEEGNRVVFVRHTLPGERVVVEVTEGTEGDRFWRGDAVEVLEAAADRVEAPCPFAGPGRCGGCDFQHVSLAGQRALKAAVVRSSCPGSRSSTVDVVVEAVPGDVDGLAGGPGWSTPWRATAAGRCASTAPTTSSRSTAA